MKESLQEVCEEEGTADRSGRVYSLVLHRFMERCVTFSRYARPGNGSICEVQKLDVPSRVSVEINLR